MISKLVTDEAIEETRKDFENETVMVLRNFSGNLPNSNDRLLEKIKEIKKKEKGEDQIHK